MQIDPQALRRHYASLSDEELLALDRTELTEVARKYYDSEFAERELTLPQDDEDAAPPEAPSTPIEPQGDWTGESTCVCTFEWLTGRLGEFGRERADHACVVLQAAGIPCRIEINEVNQAEGPEPRTEFAIMVPSNLYHQADDFLEREMFNAEREARWKTHLESLSDAEFRALSSDLLCGRYKDLIERLTRMFNDEVQRRKDR